MPKGGARRPPLCRSTLRPCSPGQKKKLGGARDTVTAKRQWGRERGGDGLKGIRKTQEGGDEREARVKASEGWATPGGREASWLVGRQASPVWSCVGMPVVSGHSSVSGFGCIPFASTPLAHQTLSPPQNLIMRRSRRGVPHCCLARLAHTRHHRRPNPRRTGPAVLPRRVAVFRVSPPLFPSPHALLLLCHKRPSRLASHACGGRCGQPRLRRVPSALPQVLGQGRVRGARSPLFTLAHQCPSCEPLPQSPICSHARVSHDPPPPICGGGVEIWLGMNDAAIPLLPAQAKIGAESVCGAIVRGDVNGLRGGDNKAWEPFPQCAPRGGQGNSHH